MGLVQRSGHLLTGCMVLKPGGFRRGRSLCSGDDAHAMIAFEPACGVLAECSLLR